MFQLLLKLLERIGRFRLLGQMGGHSVTFGKPDSPDHLGGTGWRAYLGTEALYDVWGPVSGAPWEPYHCLTLFASLDKMWRKDREKCGPVAPEPPGPSRPKWLDADMRPMVIFDLPGPQSVAAGSWSAEAGFQTVCAFDNWPNSGGQLKSELTLGALLHYASIVKESRRSLTAASPPVWLCDRNRITVKPPPGGFDNRYCIDDRLLPGPSVLRSAMISSVIYVGPANTSPHADIGQHLVWLKKEGFEVLSAPVDEAGVIAEPSPLDTGKVPPFMPVLLSFTRSSAGGFGGWVPHPSSGGSGG